MEDVKSFFVSIGDFLDKSVDIGRDIHISIMDIIILVIVLLFARAVLGVIRRLMTRRMPVDDRKKFKVVFSYGKWVIYTLIFLITMHSVGINLTGVFAASAALLIGIGLALQTLFQDIIAGIFILVDQTVHVGDIIELEGKVGRVEEIKLRTTRAVTINNKVLIIPNHLYLTNSLYNWTQNGTITRESISVGVAYGSDVQLVKKILMQVANEHPSVLHDPPPLVLFNDFGDSALMFKLIFTMGDSFQAVIPQSDMRFEIDRLFRENNIKIPFPQRDVHLFTNT
ncbi:MAG: mechanosensitive ion channel [Bacteroidia bacterium]|nr:mechanosensitive ion channel [Bacteroidia bacterium]NNL80072.1 mechanosensitive ion channel [Flavobacteriaceae bacterium]